MDYPNHIIKEGETDSKIVNVVQKRLNELGCGPLQGTGVFAEKTKAAVKLYQSLHHDKNGMPLVIDGKIGAITWEAMFGPNLQIAVNAPNALLAEVMKVAFSQVGVMEVPEGSNSGPQVDQYLASVNVPPHNYWCASFVYWCFNEAAKNLSMTNPLVQTGGCLRHWNKTTGKKILAADSINDPSLIKPGYIFIISHGGGMGHTGIVEKVDGGFLHTIEGNSNPNGSSNGIGVFNITNRKINSINKGFIAYQ